MEHESLHELTKELEVLLPTKPVREMLELYMDFSQMESTVEDGIEADWLDNVAAFYYPSGSKRASHKFLLNSESFLKKVLNTVDPEAYKLCAANPQKALSFVTDKLGLQDLFDPCNEMIHYKEEKDQLSKDEKNRMSPEELKRAQEKRTLRKSIALAYQLRNNTSHTSKDWSATEMQANANAIMVTTVYAVWLHRNIIRQHVSSTTSNNQYDIDTLLSNLIREYDKKIGKGFRYVSLLWESSETNQSKQLQLDNLLEDKQILLSGDAGCGKTTALDQLEYQAAKKYIAGQTSVIPVKLALIKENPTLSLTEMVCHKLNIPSEYYRTLLQQKNLLLLIDGLNELTTDPELKSRFVTELEQFISRYPEIRMIVTDRRYSPFPIRLNKTYHLKPLDKEDILGYAKTRPECNEKVLALLPQLLEKPSFAELEYTPLLINQLLLALSSQEKLPEDLSELIGIYLEALQKREYYEKRDLLAAKGKLDLFLMKLASEVPLGESIQLIPSYELCAEIMNKYNLKVESDACVNLAVQLGILEQTDDSIAFMLEEYHTYYLLRAMDNKM